VKKIIILIALLTFALLLTAEENLRHGLGFTGGMISGSGFSYRQMNEIYGFQFAFGAITIGDNDDIDFEDEYDDYWWHDTGSNHIMEDEGIFYHTNFGASYYKFLHKGKKSTFYFLVGAATYMNFGKVEEQVYQYNDDDEIWEPLGEPTEENEVNIRANVGFGIGIDYKLTDNIHLNLDWPLVFSKSDENLDIIMYVPQAGIHYYFK